MTRDALKAAFEDLAARIPSEPLECAHPVSYAKLRWITERCLENADTTPVEDLAVWLGYIRGVLMTTGLLDMASLGLP